MNDIDPRKRKALEDELALRKQLAGTTIDLLKFSFPAQAKFIADPSKRKAALCTRRAGKTNGTAILLINTALANPASTCVYLSYTRQTAKNTIQKEIARFLRTAKVQFQFNITELTFTLPNGSRIVLRGADKPDEVDKLRGQAYPLVVIDECGHGNYSTTLAYLINEVIEPCVAQYDGTIVLIGTPSPYLDTVFYDITTHSEKEQGWSVHHWSWEDNPHVAENQRKTLDSRLARDPEYRFTDAHKREWLGQWAIDEQLLVYRFDRTKNLIAALPPDANYRRVLSVDFGWNDATAFVIGAVSPYDPTFYLEHSEKHQRLDYDQVATKVKELASRFSVASYVADGAVKQALETLRSRYHIPFKATPKSPNYKYTAIQTMNGDFGAKRIQLIAHRNPQLIDEYSRLIWSEKDRTKENQQRKNDLCDAALYAYLEARSWNTRTQDLDDNPYPDEPVRYRPLIDQESTLDLFDYLDISTELLK